MGVTIMKDESILYEIQAENIILNENKVENTLGIIAVSLLGVVGGEPPVKFNITITNKSLYLEAIGLSSWGRLEESRYVQKIKFEDVKAFNVNYKEDKELIELTTNKNKTLYLARSNKENDDKVERIKGIIEEFINIKN